jgi:hypothetical protein
MSATTAKFKVENTGPQELTISKNGYSVTVDSLPVQFHVDEPYIATLLLTLDVVQHSLVDISTFDETEDPQPLNSYEVYRVVNKLTPPALHQEILKDRRIAQLIKERPF